MNSKWWEYYAVRYLVGTVVGAVIVAFLNGHPGSPYEARLSAFGDGQESTFLAAWNLALAGNDCVACGNCSRESLFIEATLVTG
ncbi:MAG: hypothetical protein AB7P34_14155 [Vicinamibacterales bacterium]